MRFVHLGIHTEFSITESIVRVPDLIQAAVNEEMPALALTDLSNLHAAVKFSWQMFRTRHQTNFRFRAAFK